MKRIVVFTLLSLLFQINLLAQYNIKVGSYKFLSLVAPAGYVRSAIWSFDNGLMLTEKSEAGAVVKVTHYFSGAAYVKCDYVYEYLGSYDNRYHAGRGTKTYRIQCIGGTASISNTDLKLNPGEKFTLKCTRSDSYGTPTWTSSDENVVSIDEKGRLTAIASGDARITLDPITAVPCFCNVHVNKIEAKTMVLSPNPLNVVVGKSKYLNPVYTPLGASASVEWISENENVATVSNKGLIKGITEGTTTVIAKTDNGLSAKAVVSVIGAPNAVHLPSDVTLSVGFSCKLIPTLTPSESEATYIWKSSDTSVATITPSGTIYGKKEGQTTITVTTDNKLKTSTIVNIVSVPVGLDKNTMKYRVDKIVKLVKKLSK